MIEVYKYGGNLLKDKSNRKKIYEFIKKKNSEGIKIVMVVSAFGRENDSFSTDNLGKNLELLDKKEKDEIITFGEIYSSFFIKNELLNEGVKVNNVCYDKIGIECDDNYGDGHIINVNMSHIKDLLTYYDVVIVPGFIGVSNEGKIISLGRNTSDLTGVVISDYFKLGKVNIIKEVDGVYSKDPKKGEGKLISNLSYDEMLLIVKAGSSMFSKKTLEYAKDKGIVIEVKGLDKEKGSIISEIKSDEKILFVNEEEDCIKVVFKDNEIFNELFTNLVSERIKLEELIIVNNIVYLKGDKERIMKVIKKELL